MRKFTQGTFASYAYRYSARSIKALLITALTCAFSYNSFSQTVYTSTAAGGDWNTSTTWIDGVVPPLTVLGNIDIYIVGPVTITGGGNHLSFKESGGQSPTLHIIGDYKDRATLTQAGGRLEFYDSSVLNVVYGEISVSSNFALNDQSSSDFSNANLTVSGNIEISSTGRNYWSGGCASGGNLFKFNGATNVILEAYILQRAGGSLNFNNSNVTYNGFIAICNDFDVQGGTNIGTIYSIIVEDPSDISMQNDQTNVTLEYFYFTNYTPLPSTLAGWKNSGTPTPPTLSFDDANLYSCNEPPPGDNCDTDKEPNAYDDDDDNDGILDIDEESIAIASNNQLLLDFDGDGILNTCDLDSDNDGINDNIEAGGNLVNGHFDITNTSIWTDANNDGANDNHIISSPINTDINFIRLTSGGAVVYDLTDDNPDFLDLDSDNDGYGDIAENGLPDSDENYMLDNFVDTDDNGWHDTYDPNNGGTVLPLVNSESAVIAADPVFGPTSFIDAVPDYLDPDSDNDLVPDIIENHATVDMESGGSKIFSNIDANNNGIDDNFEIRFLPPTDKDGDGKPDYLDLDSDNDTKSDSREVWGDDVSNANQTDTDNGGNGYDDGMASWALTATDYLGTGATAEASSYSISSYRGYTAAGDEPDFREAGFDIELGVFLEGAFDHSGTSGAMTTYLSAGKASSILATKALTQPYAQGGSESVIADFFDTHTDIVDWILVELIKEEPSGVFESVEKRALFVTSDGSTIDPTGRGFSHEAGNYRIAIHHRNHASIYSAIDLTVSSGKIQWDTRTANSTILNPFNNVKPITVGGTTFFVMHGGDTNGDGVINGFDYEEVKTNFFRLGYFKGDTYLDGVDNAKDTRLIDLNDNTTTTVITITP